MEKYKYLPHHEIYDKLYTPSGILKLFQDAVKEEGGVVSFFNNKHKYKKLMELWYASFLAVAIYREKGIKFWLYSSENPDIILINNPAGEQEGIPLEVMTLYNFEDNKFDGNYVELVTNVWNKKGLKDYSDAMLLLVCRLNGQMYIQELVKVFNNSGYNWKYTNILLSTFNQADFSWNLHQIYPINLKKEIVRKLTVRINEIPY